MMTKKSNKKSQEKSLVVKNDLRNNEVVGNQDKVYDLSDTERIIEKETKTILINPIEFDGMTIKETIHNIALKCAQSAVVQSIDAKVLILRFFLMHISYTPDVSVISDIVDNVYQQYPNTKVIVGCSLFSKYIIQDRTIFEIIGVSPKQEKKIAELLLSDEYMTI